ncbi:MAG: HEAT repeat domain-containing protein, partial [Candidatus Zixiibacteriota bacterium]
PAVYAQPSLKHKTDSLFIIASSGEVQYRDQNEPAMDAIAALGAPAVPYLIDKFTTKSARERWTVIWILQRIGSAAVPDLVKALGGDDPLVVRRIAWALGDIKDTASVLPLMQVATHDDWAVREQVIGALGKIGDKRADDVVMAALTDSIGQVRKAAAVACGKLSIIESVPALLHQLGDSFYGARMTAEEALLTLDTGIVVREVMDSVRSADPLVGNLACDLLGRLATPEAENILIEQISSPDPLRRAHAAVALAAIDPDDNCGVMEQYLAHEPDRLTRLKVISAREAARRE